MKITLLQTKQAEGVLTKILGQDVLAIHISYRFSKLAKAIAPELQSLEEQRVELVKKYGTENDDGNMEVSPGKNLESFMKDYNSLLQETIEVPYKKVRLKEMAALPLSPNELILFEPFFVAPKESKEENEDVSYDGKDDEDSNSEQEQKQAKKA